VIFFLFFSFYLIIIKKMTDITSKTNIFYEARQFNATTGQIQASTDVALIYPILKNASEYQVAVAKATVPLATVPLRQQNIPLKRYAVAVKQGSIIGTSYIKQINATSNNYFWDLNGLSLNKYLYTSTTNSLVSSLDLSQFMNYAYFFVIDDYLNIYVAGSATNASNPDTLFIISSLTNSVLGQLGYNNILSLYINGVQQIFVADENETGSYVDIYNNQNSETGVSLTLAATLTTDFAGNQLNNIVFVVSTLQSIIVGHDTNILTYYNLATFAPTTDYTVADVSQFTAANALNGTDTLITADANAPPDSLFGTTGLELWDVNANTMVTNPPIKGNAAFTQNNFVFAIGNDDDFLYYQTLPFPQSPVSWSLANGSNALKAICTNNNELAAVGTDNALYYFNMDLNPSVDNLFVKAANSFEIGANQIISMDYDITTSKMFAVDSANILYKSQVPVYPIQLGYVINNQLVLNGIETNTPRNYVLSAFNIDNSPVACSAYAISNAGNYYFIEGVAGSQVVVKRSPLNNQFALVASYTFAELDGNISKIAIVGNYISLANDNGNVYTYTLDTTTLYDTLPFGAGDVKAICSVDNNSILAIGYTTVGANVLNLYNLATSTLLLTSAIQTNASIVSMCSNINDVNNGCATLFIGYDTSLPVGMAVHKYTFTTGYAAIDTNIDIFQSESSSITSVSCHSNAGLIFIYWSFNGNYFVRIISQSSGYNYNYSYDPSIQLQNATFCFVAPSIDGVVGWDALTTTPAFTASSISVSRTSTTKIYTLSNLDNTIYSGNVNGLNVTLSQIPEYAAQTYNAISNIPNTSSAINTTIRTFTVSSQAPIASTVLTNQKVVSIAKNELQITTNGIGEFLLAKNNNSQIASYSSELQVNYAINVAVPPLSCLFAKNGEDIDAGPVSIMSYAPLIDAINLAFVEAYDRAKAQGATLTEAPIMSLNYQTGLCTIAYSADYTNNTGNGIYLNNALLQLIYFSAVPSTNNLLIGYNKLVLPINSSSITQSSKTIFQFNLLDKIAIQSNSIYVDNSYFGNNQQNRIITTIDVDTSEFLENLGTVLYYQPTFLRPYTLASTNAIDRIQINILYSYRDFSTYNLLLNPESNFSCYLDFVKKF
jgi:hypothetical protein